MLTIFFFTASVSLSLLLTRMIIPLAEKSGLVCPPNPLVKTHLRPIALGGGIALLAMLLPAAAWWANAGILPWRIFWALLPAGLLGLIDDIRALKAVPKLILQCLAFMPYLLLSPLSLAGTLSALLWLLALQNAWNFIDILDGLAGWTAAIALAACALVLHLTGYSGSLAALAAAGAGGCLGFLFWNSYPARIYLGDTGSLTLGALHGVLTVEAALDGGFALAWPLALAGAVPLFEMSFVLTERIRGGLPFYHPSADSIALRLLNQGWCVPDIIRRMRSAALALAVLALATAILREHVWFVLVSLALTGAGALRAWVFFRNLPAGARDSETPSGGARDA